MQEEVENKTVNLAIRSSKVTAQVLYKGLKAFVREVPKEERQLNIESG